MRAFNNQYHNLLGYILSQDNDRRNVYEAAGRRDPEDTPMSGNGRIRRRQGDRSDTNLENTEGVSENPSRERFAKVK